MNGGVLERNKEIKVEGIFRVLPPPGGISGQLSMGSWHLAVVLLGQPGGRQHFLSAGYNF